MDLELFRRVAGATLVGGRLQQAAALGGQAGGVELLTKAATHLLTGLDVVVKEEEEGGGEAHKSKSFRAKTQQELTWDRETSCSSW